MTKPKRPEVLDEPPDELLSEPSESAARIEDVIQEVVGGEDPIVKIQRRKPTYAYIGQLPVTPDFMLEEAVAQMAGGGTYVCQFYARMPGDTRLRPYRAVTVVIAGEPFKEPRRPAAVVAEPPAAAGASGDPELRLQLARLEGKLEGLTAAGPAEKVSPVTLLSELAALMKSLQPEAPRVDPMAQITGIVAAVREVVGVGREIAPESGGDGAGLWAPVISQGVDAIKTLVGEAAKQREAGLGSGAIIPPRPIADVTTPLLPEGAPMWQQEVAAWVPRLIERALAGKSAELAADVFCEDITGATFQALQPIAAQPGFVEATVAQLQALDPRVKDLAEWFTTFLEAVQEQMKEDDGEGVGPAAAPVPEVH